MLLLVLTTDHSAGKKQNLKKLYKERGKTIIIEFYLDASWVPGLLGSLSKGRRVLGGSKCVLMSIEMEVILHGMEMRRKGLIDKKKGAGRRKTEKIERKKKNGPASGD